MTSHRVGDVVGVIRRRLLVNVLVDPAEVEPLLPSDRRPHIGSSGGVVVGCCMIEIESARPWPLPRPAGVTIRAAAHRVSVEAGPRNDATRAVFVPARHTDARLAVIAGGRVFPGVHARASVAVEADDRRLSWSVQSPEGAEDGFDIHASAALEPAGDATSEVAEIVVGTVLGLSPGRHGDRLEAVEMVTAHRDVRSVELTLLESEFMAGFRTAEPAETLLMTDVDVTWRRAKVARDAHARSMEPSEH